MIFTNLCLYEHFPIESIAHKYLNKHKICFLLPKITEAIKDFEMMLIKINLLF